MIRWSSLVGTVRHPLLRVAAALGWTALACLLMLLPGKGTVAEDASNFFGGTDSTDAVGHVLLFGGLTLLWYAALSCWLAPTLARRMALVLGAALGLLLELGQGFIPERGISLLDFTANALGALVGTALIIALSGQMFARSS